MTADERAALVAERVELQRKHQARAGRAGYQANAAKLLERIEAIDAQLDANPPTGMVSLAGQALADRSSSPREKSLAASVLGQAD